MGQCNQVSALAAVAAQGELSWPAGRYHPSLDLMLALQQQQQQRQQQRHAPPNRGALCHSPKALVCTCTVTM